MSKQRIFDLPEQKGSVQIKGLVTGVKKDKFFETTSFNGRERNVLKYGVSVDENSTIYVENNEIKQEYVYFYKKSDIKGEKGIVEKVPYSQYKSFNKDGFTVIGMKNGLEKEIGEDGKEKNKLVTLPSFDAVKYLSEKLEDGMSVFINGTIDFSSYNTQTGETKRNTKFVPESVFLSSEIDFKSEGYEQVAKFQQTFVYTGVEKDDSDKDDIKFIVSGYVVKYSTIEQVEFILRNENIAISLRKQVKPYTAMKVGGAINNKLLAEEVEDDLDLSCWGNIEQFAPKKKASKFARELVITGIDPNSFDTDTYTEKEIGMALKAIEDSKNAKLNFGEKVESFETGDDLTFDDLPF